MDWHDSVQTGSTSPTFSTPVSGIPTSNSLMELVSLWQSGSLCQFQEQFLTRQILWEKRSRSNSSPSDHRSRCEQISRYKHQNFRNGHKAAVHVNLIAKPAAVGSRLVSNSHRKTTRCQAGQFACHGRCKNYNHCTTCYGPQLHREFRASTRQGPSRAKA